MTDEIKSADDLFDLLAADGSEVPSILIRGGKTRSAHEKALIEQDKLSRLNAVEVWMKSENAIQSDPQEFVSVVETLFKTLCKAEKSELSGSLVDKLRKLIRSWLEITKSCKLVEGYIEAENIVGLLKVMIRAKSLSAKEQESCGKVILGMVQCSPEKLFRSKDVIKGFNLFVSAWCRGRYRGNGSGFLSMFPVEFLSQLQWVGTGRSFVLGQELDLVVRIMKKGFPVQVDQDELLSFVGSKEVDEVLLKFCGALVRGKVEVSGSFRSWVKSVSEKDTKMPGVSGKNHQLATQLMKSLTNL